jgi:hypothetical protein
MLTWPVVVPCTDTIRAAALAGTATKVLFRVLGEAALPRHVDARPRGGADRHVAHEQQREPEGGGLVARLAPASTGTDRLDGEHEGVVAQARQDALHDQVDGRVVQAAGVRRHAEHLAPVVDQLVGHEVEQGPTFDSAADHLRVGEARGGPAVVGVDHVDLVDPLQVARLALGRPAAHGREREVLADEHLGRAAPAEREAQRRERCGAG